MLLLRPLQLAAVAMLLQACGGLTAATSQPTGTPPGTTSEDEPGTKDPSVPSASGDTLTITAISPNLGSNAGGYIATIEGTDFPDAFDVTIGGVEATVISSNATSIEVEVPQTSQEGWTDVTVFTASGVGRLEDAFQYWQAGEGLTGGLLTLERARWVGGYWDSAPAPSAWASLSFFRPNEYEYWKDFTDTFGGCSHNYSWTQGFDYYLPGASSITLANPAGTITLEPDTEEAGIHFSPTLAASAIAAGSYDLDEIRGDANWPVFDLPDVVEPQATIGVTTPPVGQNIAPLVNAGFDVSWDGTASDYVVLFVLHYSAAFSGVYEPVQAISCATPDTGAFSVPSTAWPAWRVQDDDYLVLQVGRVREDRRVLPYNDAELSVVSVSWTIGAMDMRAN